jgi:hypothetical protein
MRHGTGKTKNGGEIPPFMLYTLLQSPEQENYLRHGPGNEDAEYRFPFEKRKSSATSGTPLQCWWWFS